MKGNNAAKWGNNAAIKGNNAVKWEDNAAM